MSRHAVHWHEGMFLRPHHFQAATRHAADLVRQNVQWDSAYHWGLRSIDIDQDALRNFRFVVNRLRARLRDGTVVNVPDDGVLTPIDLRKVFEADNQAGIFLALPEVLLNRANVSEGDTARYRVVVQEGLQDENTGASGQRIELRGFNLRLLTDRDDPAGYQVIKIAEVEKSARQDALPELSDSYIPPVLACEAWKPLKERVLAPIADRVGQVLKQRAKHAVSRKVSFESSSAKDRRLFELVRVLNAAYSTMTVTHFADGVHPLWVYADLARVIGELAIFDDDKRETPDLPRYDHDDLGHCFYEAKRHIDRLVGLEDQDYRTAEFHGAGLQIQCQLQAEWLAANWQMFVGVQAPLKSDECISLLNGKLNMKIGSVDHVEEFYRKGERGLKFTHAPRPPRALPVYADLNYFKIDRAVQPQEWKQVEATLMMGIRLSEDYYEGNIERMHQLKIRAFNKVIPITFTLYILPPGLAEIE